MRSVNVHFLLLDYAGIYFSSTCTIDKSYITLLYITRLYIRAINERVLGVSLQAAHYSIQLIELRENYREEYFFISAITQNI